MRGLRAMQGKIAAGAANVKLSKPGPFSWPVDVEALVTRLLAEMADR